MPPNTEPLEGVAMTPTDVTYEARMKWPYLAGWHTGGNVPQNGRELGCWIAGHFGGRHIHGEPGLRVEIPEKWVAGVCSVLLEYGLIVQRHTVASLPSGTAEATLTLDVWAY